MTVKELREYLSTFKDSEELAVIIINPKKRIVHKHDSCYVLTDIPCFCIETTETESMDT